MQNEIEVMRVIRIPPMGQLVVAVNGKRVRKIGELQNEPLKRRLLAAVGELVAFAGGYENLVAAGLAPPLSLVEKERVEQVEQPLTERQAAFLASLEEELKAAARGTISTAVPLEEITALEELPGEPVEESKTQDKLLPEQVEEVTTPRNLSVVEPVEEETPNMVAEIDQILQKHVADEPKLDGRAIHLHQPLDGELQIRVDGAVYHHPKEINDRQIRLVIKKALQEWEGR